MTVLGPQKLSESSATSFRTITFWICFGISILVIGIYCYWIVNNPAWVLGDDDLIVRTVVKGIPLHLDFRRIGRFNPLGLIDLNLLLWAGNQPFFFLFYSALRLIGISLIFGLALKNRNPELWPMFLLGFLLLFSVILVHLYIFHVEPLLMILFSGFALAYWKALETRNKNYLVIAAICSCIAIYQKEPVFVTFTAIAILGMLFHSREDRRFTKTLNLFLLGNSLLFVVQYYFISYIITTKFYSIGKAETFLDGFLPMLRNDKPMLLFFLLGFVRILALIRGDRRHVLSDIFLIGGLAFVCAYLGIRMYKPYCVAPAYIFLFLALADYCRSFSLLKLGTLSVLIILLFWESPKIIEHKKLAHRLRRDQVKISATMATYSQDGFDLVYLSTDKPDLMPKQTYRIRVLNEIPESQYPQIPTIKLIDAVPLHKSLVIAGPESRIPDPSLVRVMATKDYKLYRTR